MADLHPAARELVDALVAKDDARPRTRQKGPGVSSLGDCARKVFHLMRFDEPCNPNVRRLPAILGTGFHKVTENAGLPGLTEVPLTVPGIDLPGTADRIHDGVLTDWKFTKLATVAFVRENGPSRNYLWQAMTYGFAWNAERDAFDEPDFIHTVRIVFVPKDGTEDDIYVYEAPYDEDVALEAIDWYRRLEALSTVDELAPAPEKDAAFCAKFCQFFGELCPGKTEIEKDEPELDDPWAASAAADYAEGIALEKRGKALKERAKGALEGVRGVVGGYRIGWVQRKPGEALDADAIRADYAARGERVPMKTTAGAEYPSVRAVKAKEASGAD